MPWHNQSGLAKEVWNLLESEDPVHLTSRAQTRNHQPARAAWAARLPYPAPAPSIPSNSLRPRRIRCCCNSTARVCLCLPEPKLLCHQSPPAMLRPQERGQTHSSAPFRKKEWLCKRKTSAILHNRCQLSSRKPTPSSMYTATRVWPPRRAKSACATAAQHCSSCTSRGPSGKRRRPWMGLPLTRVHTKIPTPVVGSPR